MIRVALKGLAARPVRTALTTLAIVLGVAMVSAAFTLTDTMRGAADSLSSAAYDGTDAVVVREDRVRGRLADRLRRSSRPPIAAAMLAEVRAVPQVGVAVGDITDEAQIIGARRQARRRRPVLRRRLRRAAAGAAKLTPFRLQSGRWATGPGEVVIDAGTAEQAALRGRRQRSASPPRGEADTFRVVGIARFGAVKSLGTATVAVFDLEHRADAVRTRRAATTRSSSPAAGTSGADVRRRSPPPSAQRRGPDRGRRTTASRSTGSSSSSRSSGSSCSSSAASRSSSARSRSSTRCRSPSPSARASSRCCGWSAPRAARCSARCCSRRWRSALRRLGRRHRRRLRRSPRA